MEKQGTVTLPARPGGVQSDPGETVAWYRLVFEIDRASQWSKCVKAQKRLTTTNPMPK